MNDQDRDNLVAYLDGELDEDTARSIEAKMNTDPALRAEADALKQAWDMLEYLPRAEATSNFTHRTMDRLALQEPISTMAMPSQKPWQRLWAGVFWAAALLVAAVVGVVLAQRLFPRSEPPPDNTLERALIRDLRIIQNQSLYNNIDDIDFLQKLNDPDLFGNQGLQSK